MKESFAQRRRFAAVVLVATLLFASLLLITPQGRAWAQGVLRFFSRAAQERRPVPTLLATLEEVTMQQTVSPLPEATRSPESLLPFQETCGSFNFARCSLAEIRELVDFPVLEPAALPEGWEFSGATGGPNLVWLNFQSLAGGLRLSQGPGDFPDQIDWPIGADAEVETVEIGAVTGEYVQGTWLDTGQSAGAVTWDARIPTRTLRWEAEGIRYTLQYFPAKTNEGIRLDQAMLVELASHLTPQTALEMQPTATPNLALEDIRRQAGFEITEPSWIPERYVFKKATYTTQYNAVCLFYGSPDSEMHPFLAVIQSPWVLGLDEIKLPQQYFNEVPINIPVHTEYVTLGGAPYEQALYASNGLTIDSVCNVKNVPSNHALIWQFEGKNYVVSAALDAKDGREFLTRQEMHRIAESITGVSTIPEGELDPEYLPSVEAAEALAGFDVKAPSQMPADTRFAYAVYRNANAPVGANTLAQGSPEVILVYFGTTRDSIERRHSYLIFQNVVPMNTLEEMILGGGEWVTVSGKPAVLYQYCSDGSNGGIASCNLNLSWMDEGGIRFDLFAYLPGALDQATAIAIAESMK